jgi:hypothetical protein
VTAALRTGLSRIMGTFVSVSPQVRRTDAMFCLTCCDDASMTTLTQEEIAGKIATAESGFAAATSGYSRNLFAQIRDEYKRYAVERAKEEAKLATAASASES